MSAPIGPGDFIECVDAANLRLFGFIPTPVSSGLQRGAVYVVGSAWDEPGPLGRHPVVLLRDIWQPYSVKRFRPVYRPKQELIASLKAPPKVAPIQKEPAFAGSAALQCKAGRT